MRVTLAGVAIGVGGLVSAGGAWAQGIPGVEAGARGPVECTEFLHAVGLPFSATLTERTVKTLANGSTMTTGARTTEARDSRGRVYRATEFLRFAGKEEVKENEEGRPKVLVMQMFDPAAQTMSTWSTGQGSTTVQVMHIRGLGEDLRRAPSSTEVPLLDGKMVNGVYAVGYHVTGRTEAGKEGNDQPMVSTHEWWCSPELRLNISDVTDDPRWGRRTIELTDIVRREPDAALFALPEGYKVKRVTVGDED